MADQLAFLPERVFTAAAMPGTGYQVRFYASGTTTPVDVYTSAALDTPHVQPIVCDALGVFPQVFSAGGAVKAVVTKPDDSVFYTVDPAFRVPTSASGAVDITFSPTGPLPFTNVQAAIEGSVAAAATGFNAFGLGITGNAVLLASIDATNIAAGTYRFDGTTTGTYPTGVAAADTGLIEHWRQSAAVAMQFLYHATTDRIFHRRMAATTWGTWRENITTNQGATRGDTIRRGASAWERLALPANGQFLRSDGTDVLAASGGYTWLAAQVTTSGTTFDFTSIPSWATECRVMFSRVRITAGSIAVQLRVSGSPVVTGYASAAGTLDGTGSNTVFSSTGFALWPPAATGTGLIGNMDISKWPGTNKWVASFAMSRPGTSDGTQHGGGDITLAGVLDGVRMLITGGTGNLGEVVVGYR